MSRGFRTAQSGLDNETFIINKLKTDDNFLNKVLETGNYNNLTDITVNSINNKKSDCEICKDNKSILNIQVKSYKGYGVKSQIHRGGFNKLNKIVQFDRDSVKLLTSLFKHTTKIKELNYNNKLINNLLIDLDDHKKQIVEFAVLGTDNNYKPDIHIFIQIFKNKRNIRIIKTSDFIKFILSKETYIDEIGNPNIGYLKIKRKGGDNGKKSANDMQIVLTPNDLEYIDISYIC
jgi:hypothetical protein